MMHCSSPVDSSGRAGSPVSRRRGLTKLEVLGALAAALAGTWLGASYLGVDLREVWNLAVDTAGFQQLGFELPTQQQNGDLDGTTVDPADVSASDSPENAASRSGDPSPESTVGKEYLESEVDQLRKAIDQLSNRNENGDSSVVPPVSEPTSRPQAEATGGAPGGNSELQKAVIGRQTLAYWEAMNAIMLKEEQMRAAPDGGLTAANAGTFLAGRGKANRFAAKSIRNLATKNVDPFAISLAADIAAWYEAGAKINDQATFLMNEADPSARRGPLGESWQAAERQHQMEVELLNRRGDDLQEQLTVKYGLTFPDLR